MIEKNTQIVNININNEHKIFIKFVKFNKKTKVIDYG